MPHLTTVHKYVKFGHAMGQAPVHEPVTVEARVRFEVSPYEICGGKSDIGTGFSLSTFVFPIILLPVCHTDSLTCHRCCIVLRIGTISKEHTGKEVNKIIVKYITLDLTHT